MAKRSKIKAPALPVPQTRDEAAEAIRRIGELQRDIEALQVGCKDEMADLNDRYARRITPRRDEIARLTDGLRVWAEARRRELTGDGRTKTARLATGEVSWRVRPPRVVARAVETVLSAIRERSLIQFLRVKEELDKEAMLAEPDLARTIPGVTIASEGEDFVVTPYPAAEEVA